MVITDTLAAFFLDTRQHTESLCKPLEIEDYVVQPIEFVSPPKWHLAHSTWFFEEFVLKPFQADYKIYHKDFSFIFNSYYENVGKRVLRTDRGNLSRPTVAQIYDYRKHVTNAMAKLFEADLPTNVRETIEIGIHHEKQHQELLLCDIKYILGNNPLFPVYDNNFIENPTESTPQKWIEIGEGIYKIGHQNPEEFCYDNELAAHKVLLESFQISNQPVTNGAFMEFIKAGGYEDVNLWHSDGWAWKNENHISAPMYWHEIDGEWFQFTLHGLKKVNPAAALSHISYYEAFAFAQWCDCRLPTEFEWEAAAREFEWGIRWEWTESAYLPYPHYQKAPGAIGEYNGKFMVNQKVLRGKSVATPKLHSRKTYRNFFQPDLRWQFTGIRLAK